MKESPVKHLLISQAEVAEIISSVWEKLIWDLSRSQAVQLFPAGQKLQTFLLLHRQKDKWLDHALNALHPDIYQHKTLFRKLANTVLK